ncbi:right-handed parallel beta-helix repeat-containing protein [Mucilaginibacter sp. Mucisp84]|uniref:right-handed parallel beta-helix repeat-containing protein n=1 Tax=Mucilaginibacter sp. Mucisp84 TaxID=3243058 RepID=UPI0039A49A1E
MKIMHKLDALLIKGKITLIGSLLFVSSLLSWSFVLNSDALQGNGTTYYIDAKNGNDSNNGTSITQAWRSIRKINAVRLISGDQVLLKRGCSWNEQLTPMGNGSVAKPIIIADYGIGSLPEVTGFEVLKAWRSRGGGVWASECPSCSAGVNMVVLNNVVQGIGRYPNMNAPNGGYLTIDSHNGNSISDNGLSGSQDWTGAEIVIRKNHWIIDRNSILSQSGNSISYKSASNYPAVDKFGFFVQNSAKTLDKAGEWYFDPTAKKMLMFFGNNDPNNMDIKVSTKASLLSITKISNIVVNNIAFTGSNKNTIFVNGANNVSLTNISINYSGGNAVTIVNTHGLVISGSTIKNTNNNAILSRFNCDSININHNVIKNTGTIPGMGESGDGSYSGILIKGAGNVVSNNEIDSTGYNPIAFQGDIIVKNNVIDYFNFVKDDGGGIYTGDSNNNIQLNGTRQIIGNLVFNGVNARPGTEPERYAASSSAPWPSCGIYMDDNTKNVIISGNTVAHNNGAGIFIHNAYNITVKDNTAYDNFEQLLFSYSFNFADEIAKNNKVSNNIFVSGDRSKYVADFRSNKGSVAVNKIGAFRSNVYMPKPGQKELNIQSSFVGVPLTSSGDMSNWKSDYDSKNDSSFQKVSMPSAVRFECNRSDKPKVIILDGVYQDVKKNIYSKKITLQPFTSILLSKK